MEQTRAAFGMVKDLDRLLIEGLGSIKWAELLAHVIEHVKNNPVKTAFLVAPALVSFAPGFVAGPILAMLGFAVKGPVAGGAAAAFQAVHGAIRGFRYLQSAAMGGYGTAVVNGVISVISMVIAAVLAMMQWSNKGEGGANITKAD